jgi:Predicted branched-chain amino acid permeases (azaleucine resistance)
MPVNATTSFLIILIMALVTFATRATPFLIFPKGKEVPKVVQYLGKVLTPAVIGLMVVYCLRETKVLTAPYGLAELIAGGAVVILHIWKRNNLLSIGAGTAIYMVLMQTVFR